MANLPDLSSLTTEELTQLLPMNGDRPYTTRVVQKWASSEGMPHHLVGSDLRFDWHQALNWFLLRKFRGSVASSDGETPTKSEAEARLLTVKARREEIRLAKDESDILSATDVDHEWTRRILSARARLLAIPSRLRGPLGAQVATSVETEVFAALSELAKEWPNG